jgi:4-amino-4-deoxy-L-arabinose transferase-like glycosyltransferase
MGTTSAEMRPDAAPADASDESFRVSEIWREVPRAVWLVVLLHVLVMLCQTAVFPNIRAPDELRHFDMIVSVEKGNAWPWPDPGTLRLNRGSAAAGFVPGDRLEKRLALADRQIPPRSSRESFAERGGSTPVESGRKLSQTHNNMVQHPPLYYLGEAAVLAAMGHWEDDPLDRILLLLRWSNVFLLAALPLLLFATARRLGLPQPVPLAASLFPLLVPELTRSGGSVNNDNLLILAGALLALLLTRVLTGDTSRRTALWVGAVTTVALLTKGLALVFPAWVAATYAVALYRTRRLSVVWSALVAGALTCVGLAWWVKNKLAYGLVQPDGLRTEPRDLPVRFFWEDWGHAYVARYAERMVTTFFVQDQAGTRLHDTTWWLARVVLLLLVVGILTTLVLGVLRRVDALVLIVPTGLLAGLVAKGSWASFSVLGLYAALQGRYLFGAATALAVVAAAALARLPERLRRPVPLLLLGLGAVIHLANTAKSLNLFWAPAGTSVRTWDGLRESLAALVEWYALPPVVPLILVTGVTLVFLVTAVELLRSTRPGYPGAP